MMFAIVAPAHVVTTTENIVGPMVCVVMQASIAATKKKDTKTRRQRITGWEDQTKDVVVMNDDVGSMIQ